MLAHSEVGKAMLICLALVDWSKPEARARPCMSQPPVAAVYPRFIEPQKRADALLAATQQGMVETSHTTHLPQRDGC